MSRYISDDVNEDLLILRIFLCLIYTSSNHSYIWWNFLTRNVGRGGYGDGPKPDDESESNQETESSK